MSTRNTRWVHWVLTLAIAAAYFTIFPPAFAQTAAAKADTILVVGWGNMVADFAKWAFELILPILSAAILAGAARLPWWVTMFLTTQRVDRALRTGADYAINAVKGATHDKSLSVEVGYEVIKVGLERILGSTPQWIVNEMGGSKGIAERLFRVFKFDETVTDKNTLQKVINDLPSLPFVRDA